MIIKVQEILLESGCIFDAHRYPESGFYKVIWADNVQRTGSLMFVPVNDDTRNLAKVQFISEWNKVGPFVFDDLLVMHKENHSKCNELNCKCGKKNDSEQTVPTLGKKLQERTKAIELLEIYSQFLEEHGYTDTDWRAEKPFAIDTFLKEVYDKKA